MERTDLAGLTDVRGNRLRGRNRPVINIKRCAGRRRDYCEEVESGLQVGDARHLNNQFGCVRCWPRDDADRIRACADESEARTAIGRLTKAPERHGGCDITRRRPPGEIKPGNSRHRHRTGVIRRLAGRIAAPVGHEAIAVALVEDVRRAAVAALRDGERSVAVLVAPRRNRVGRIGSLRAVERHFGAGLVERVVHELIGGERILYRRLDRAFLNRRCREARAERKRDNCRTVSSQQSVIGIGKQGNFSSHYHASRIERGGVDDRHNALGKFASCRPEFNRRVAALEDDSRTGGDCGFRDPKRRAR